MNDPALEALKLLYERGRNLYLLRKYSLSKTEILPSIHNDIQEWYITADDIFSEWFPETEMFLYKNPSNMDDYEDLLNYRLKIVHNEIMTILSDY